MYSAQKCTKINNVDMKGETSGVRKHIKGVTIPEMKQSNRFRKIFSGKRVCILKLEVGKAMELGK